MQLDTWNPAQYEKFRREREQPFFDLLTLIRAAPDMRVVDLGCGTGKLTRLLHARLQAAETVGIDRSARMLEEAGAYLPAGLRFEVGTIESFDGRGQYDLIVSNAAFHWVEHHDALIARLSDALRPAGRNRYCRPTNTRGCSIVPASPISASASRCIRTCYPRATMWSNG